MNGDKLGKNAIKTTDGISNRVFGTIELPKLLYSKIVVKANPLDNRYIPFEEKQKISPGIDHEKRPATAAFFGFQNRYL